MIDEILYAIKDWDRLFENSTTRKLEQMKRVQMPNKHDGLTFRLMASQSPDDACRLFAAWNLVVQLASKAPRGQRGLLIRDGKPMTSADMSLMTGFPSSVFELALEFFVNHGWITACEFSTTNLPLPPDNLPVSPTCPPLLLSGEERRGKDRIGEEGSRDCDEDWLTGMAKNQTYEGIDVRREFGKMVAWCSENSKQPSRRRFVNWLNRCERPIRSEKGLLNAGSLRSSKQASTWELKQQLEAIDAQITEITNRGAHVATGWTPANENDRQQIFDLRRKRKEIVEQIGRMK